MCWSRGFVNHEIAFGKMCLTGPARRSLLSHRWLSWHIICLFVVSPAHVEFGGDGCFWLSPGLLRRKVDTSQRGDLPGTQQENRECETVEALRNQAGMWCLLEYSVDKEFCVRNTEPAACGSQGQESAQHNPLKSRDGMEIQIKQCVLADLWGFWITRQQINSKSSGTTTRSGSHLDLERKEMPIAWSFLCFLKGKEELREQRCLEYLTH